MKKELQIAKILRPHGIKGLLKVAPLISDVPFSSFKTVLVGMNKELMHIERVQPLHEFWLIQVREINTCEQAEFYRNQLIYADKDMYSDILDSVVLPSEMIGAKVYDENNNTLGIVVDVDDFAPNKTLTISENGMSYMVPLVDEIIKYDKKKACFVADSKRYLETRV